jgi:adenylate kinase family enzyme
MSKPRGILICGLNGAGKTTLARELARMLGYKHMDAEDYYFLSSDVPYTRSRRWDEYTALMLADMEIHPKFVFSSVRGDFGDEIIRCFDLVVLIDVPKEIRLARIVKRAIDQFGERVLSGGDMHEEQEQFHTFAASRPEDYTEQWVKTLSCPVIRIDGTRDYHDTVREIAEYIKGKCVMSLKQIEGKYK